MRIRSSCFHRVSSAKGAPAPLLVPEIYESPPRAGASLPEQHLLCNRTVSVPPWLFGVQPSWEALGAELCLTLSPAVTTGKSWRAPRHSTCHGTGTWKPRVPCGGCGGWQQCWRVEDQGSKFANDPLSYFQKRTSQHHLSVPSL